MGELTIIQAKKELELSNEKVCIYCRVFKSLECFKKDKNMTNGRSNMCSDCYRLKYRKPKAIEEQIVDLPGEKWAFVGELNNRYIISNYGRFVSLNYNREGRKKLMVIPISKGYHRISVSFLDIKINLPIHRLVGKYFIPNPNNKPVINHIDGVKTNNHFSNLEWCTSSENQLHAFRIGLQSNIGEKHSRSKITDDQATEVKKRIALGQQNKTIVSEMQITSGIVEHIRGGRRWKHI